MESILAQLDYKFVFLFSGAEKIKIRILPLYKKILTIAISMHS